MKGFFLGFVEGLGADDFVLSLKKNDAFAKQLKHTWLLKCQRTIPVSHYR